MKQHLNKSNILKALKRMDESAPFSFEMIIGGGVAMLIYGSSLHTWDIDVILKKASLDQIKKHTTQVAKEFNLPDDWINSWFSSFTYTLPRDFTNRLKTFFKGKNITAQVLGKEDLLILKCCAHRSKDKGHARILIRSGVDHVFVMKHLEKLAKKKILQNTITPIEFLEDVLDEELS